MNIRIDRAAVLWGAAVGFAVAMPVLILFSVVDLAGSGIDCGAHGLGPPGFRGAADKKHDRSFSG